ncbi:MAG: GlsB/YeaQ/YmgE family stress response membrane protein [Chloroflexi bacterium]|nr:GlsB/YeaQ/YmgE family stress response membrane protein [Chloroflexota bacterium]
MLVAFALILAMGTWAAVGLISLAATLVVAGLVGWAADMVVPGELPGSWVGAVLAGLIGGFIGSLLFKALGIHDPGFAVLGVDLLPAFIGAVIVVVAVELYTTRRPVV